MKLSHFLSVLFVSGLVSVVKADDLSLLQSQNRLTVLTYNVRNAIGLDGRRDMRRIADVIRKSNADVVALQELDSVTNRSAQTYVLGDIAAQALMYPYYAPAIDYDGGKYGIGILTRHRPLSVRRIAMPGREENRTLLLLEFDRYVMGCTHFSLNADDRQTSVSILTDEAAKLDKPLILAGDFNATPDSKALKALTKVFKMVNKPKSNTFPADKPDRTIDYIMTYGDNAPVALRSWVMDESVASDHRPVLATMQFVAAPEDIVYHKPYLQNASSEAMTVMYQTRVPAHTVVEYGTDTLNLQRARQFVGGQEVVHDIEHKVRLTGLEAGQKYYYRVVAREILDNQSYSKTFGREVKTPFYTFATPSDKAYDWTMIVMNDLHENPETVEAMSQLARQIPHDMVVFNGDCLPEPSDRSDAMHYLHWLSDEFDGASKPIVYIRGNHEIRNAYSSGAPSLFDRERGLTYGAFTLGDTRIVMLDCGEDKPDDTPVYYGLNDFTGLRNDQLEWLDREIGSRDFKRSRHRILIHHIPVWGNGDKYRPCTELWGPLLKKTKFDVNLVGHTHKYKYHPAGSKEGNPWPVIVGGAPKVENATMMVVKNHEGKLTVSVLDARGREKQKLEL